MADLKHTHLLTMQLTVDYAGIKSIGKTPGGLRRIAPVTGGTFSGERLSGAVHGGADWVINRPDGVMVIDVRLTLETGDGALIYLTYQGRFLAETEAMRRFGKGELLAPHEMSAAAWRKLVNSSLMSRFRPSNSVVCESMGGMLALATIHVT